MVSWVSLSSPRSRRASRSAGLAMGGSPLRAPYSQPTLQAGYSRPCLRATIAPSGAAGLLFGLALDTSNRPLVGGLGRGLAVGGRPCMGVGRGWPPLLLAGFAAKMQQECVERFYAIQSHHTQFKTNLLHENLSSDTTIGKPQRREGGE
ncbi:hypothetical protein GW17_00019700 [Ensete ventricosum]|nr:hypothetical protein GW17_00019700 [Ensete ventricosum]